MRTCRLECSFGLSLSSLSMYYHRYVHTPHSMLYSKTTSLVEIAPQCKWVYAFDFDTRKCMYVLFHQPTPLSSKAIDHITAIKDDKPVRHANHEGSGSAGPCKALADVSFFRKKKERKKKKQRKKKVRSEKTKKIIPLQPPPILPTPPHPRLLS